ncbi:MAG: hypothetical protein ACFB10_11600 [Salibacteraceae bacterium]
MKCVSFACILLIQALFGCSNPQTASEKRLSEEFSEDKFSNCSAKNQWELEAVVNGSYSIDLPANWQIGIVNNGQMLFATDTTLSMHNTNSIKIDEISFGFHLESYFNETVARFSTVNEELKFLDCGNATVAHQKALWMAYQAVSDTINQDSYAYYIQNKNVSPSIYILETYTTGSQNIEQRHCDLRKIVETFQFVE